MSLQTDQSVVINPYDTKMHQVEEGNLNIKQSMRASYGIVYQEGRGHHDQGPSYFDSITDNGLSRTKLTL